MKTKEKIIGNFGLSIKNAAKTICEFAAGVVFSCSGTGGMFPFGTAYSYSSGIFGAMGVIIGCLVNGNDIIRYCVATVLNFTAKSFFGNALRIKKEYSAFLFTLWSIMASGIIGLFTVKTDFTKNCLFMITAPVSAVFAYIFSITKSSFEGDKKLTSQIRFIFMCISFSALIPGLIYMGLPMKYTTTVAVYTLLFCISGKCALYVSATVASIVGITVFICEPSQPHTVFTLVFGAIGAGVLKSFGKYPVVLAYVASGALSSVIFDSEDFLPTLICLVISGTVYSTLPSSLIKKFGDFIAADLNIQKHPTVKRTNVFKAEMPDVTQKICGKCKNKYRCWVKDFNKTTEYFNYIKQNRTIPDYFRESCIKIDEIAQAFIPNDGIRLKETHASASVTKKGENICGDTCTVFRANDGKIIFCITDGMGSGDEAGKESVKISVMIKRLLSDGLDKNDVMRIVNDSLLRCGKETVMGIDITILDENNGKCEFIKAGAAPSYIIRDGNVFEIGSSSVPIGMLENVSLNKTRCHLEVGDKFIMISDGLICDEISNMLADSNDAEPIDIARKIIKKATENRLTESDDVSIIAVCINRKD